MAHTQHASAFGKVCDDCLKNDTRDMGNNIYIVVIVLSFDHKYSCQCIS